MNTSSIARGCIGSRHQCGAVLAKTKSRCGLGDAGQRLISNLSKGYQQRVGIAQAILHAPRW